MPNQPDIDQHTNIYNRELARSTVYMAMYLVHIEAYKIRQEDKYCVKKSLKERQRGRG